MNLGIRILQKVMAIVFQVAKFVKGLDIFLEFNLRLLTYSRKTRIRGFHMVVIQTTVKTVLSSNVFVDVEVVLLACAPLYYCMRNFCNLIGLEQWYFSLI